MSKKTTIIIVSVLAVILAVILLIVGLKACGSNGKADELSVDGSDQKGYLVDLETGSIIEEVDGNDEKKDKDDNKGPYVFEPGSSNSDGTSSSQVSDGSSDVSDTTSNYLNPEVMEGYSPWQ